MNTVFFLGAGVSKETGTPTEKELWKQVILKWQETGNKKLKQLLDFASYLNLAKQGEIVNADFSQLLTIIDLSLERNASLGCYDEDLLREIRRNMVYAMCLVLENIFEPEKMKSFRVFCTQLSPRDTVITLNYDTVLDRIMEHYIGRVSYGFKSTINYDNKKQKKGNREQLLLKPHGSLNWLFCNCCNQIFLLSPSEGLSWLDKDKYCPFDSHVLQNVIIAPSYYKRFSVPQLHDVWNKCFHRIKEAQVVNFIGYSFPPGDIHIIYLIKKAILAGHEIPQINIITPDPRGAVLKRCEKMFANYHYYKMSFDQYFKRYG